MGCSPSFIGTVHVPLSLTVKLTLNTTVIILNVNLTVSHNVMMTLKRCFIATFYVLESRGGREKVRMHVGGVQFIKLLRIILWERGEISPTATSCANT